MVTGINAAATLLAGLSTFGTTMAASIGCVAGLFVVLLIALIVVKARAAKRADEEEEVEQPREEVQPQPEQEEVQPEEVQPEEAREEEQPEEVQPQEVQPEPEPEPEEEAQPEEAHGVKPVIIPVGEEDDADNALTYNRSFEARLIQADDELKNYYSVIKNAILAYKGVNARMSWKYEKYSFKRNPFAKLIIKGKTLCLYLPLDPAEFAESKYKIEDVSGISQFAETPVLYRIKNDRRLKYAAELIAQVGEKLGVERTDRAEEDYYMPYCGTLTLIERGLIKRVIQDKKTAFIAGASEADDGEND